MVSVVKPAVPEPSSLMKLPLVTPPVAAVFKTVLAPVPSVLPSVAVEAVVSKLEVSVPSVLPSNVVVAVVVKPD